MKLLVFFISFTMLVFSATTTHANADCTGNTSDCTPLQLCEASTTVIDGNTVWSDDPVFVRHVATAKQIGLDCGVQDIIEPTCETDAELCTIVALCEQATKQLSDGSSISWSDEKTEHVRLAQEYGLMCDVTASPEQVEVAEMPANADELSDVTICGLAAMTHTDATIWQAIAESRSLTCDVSVGEVTNTSEALESAESFEEYSDLKLCNLIRRDPNNDQVSVWREETYARRLNCVLLLGLPTREETAATFSDTSLCHFLRTDPRNYDATVWQNEATTRGLDCGSSDVLQEVPQRHEIGTRTVQTDFRNSFRTHSLLYRQQIQYALRELEMYSSGIDGIWGPRTNEAIQSFVEANGLHTNGPNDVFRRIVGMVDVPISFAPPRSNPPNRPSASNTRSPSNSAGLTAIVSNPSMPAAQALAVCRPQAELARTQASNAYTPPSYGYSGNCTGFGNNYNCSVQQNSGGFWGGFAEGISRGLDGRAAYNSVLRSCLAQYGWRN